MSSTTQNRLIWLSLLVFSLALEGAALVFQYVLDYGPCILCVQIRAVLLVIALIALGALLLPKVTKISAPLLTLPSSAAFVWLCYQVLGIERGWFEGSCTFEPAFPSWIPLHEWLPSVFEPWELCGYTPDIIFGITMAEMLMAISIIYLVISFWLLRNIRRH